MYLGIWESQVCNDYFMPCLLLPEIDRCFWAQIVTELLAEFDIDALKSYEKDYIKGTLRNLLTEVLS